VLVGFPRSPLPRLSRSERSAIKKVLQQKGIDLDPPVALRMALCGGAWIDPKWLDSGVIDLALDTDDIARNINKLSDFRKVIRANQVSAVLARRLDSSPAAVLRAIYKLSVPKRGPKKPTADSAFDDDTALALVRLATALLPVLLRGRSPAQRKRSPKLLTEVVSSVVSSAVDPDVAVRGLDFVRMLEKQVGWSELEREPIAKLRDAILEAPARLAPKLIQRGCVVDATLLAERVRPFEAADRKFRDSIARLLEASGEQLPLVSRTWAQRFVQSNGIAKAAGTSGDAAYERLALVLISIWEARKDGESAEYAFRTSEEVLRHGFGLHLVGEVGSVVPFDPDVHESKAVVEMGEDVRLDRPSVELRREEELKILIRARVVPVPEP